MKRTITMFLTLASVLVLFASCNITPASFYIKTDEMTYGKGKDTIHIKATCDISNVNIVGLKCWWTFDGTEPTKNSPYTNVTENVDKYTNGVDLAIPSDFYKGKIKLLCEIEYFERRIRKTALKRTEKEFSTEYHSIPEYGAVNLTLSKGKGFQKEYALGMAPNNDVLVFDVSETGTLKVTFLEHPEYFKVDNVNITSEVLTNNTYTKEITSDHATIDMRYIYGGFTSKDSPDYGKKTGEYLIVLE